ncbi:uncharacterized protein [Antedon mediterranea]|uniref:uncharacterized protein n=1 Tax=Antedon mediterranea TaxID=105859 RepID=UPI003AF4513B
MDMEFITLVGIFLLIIFTMIIYLCKNVNKEVTSKKQIFVNTTGNVNNGVMDKTAEFKIVVNDILDLLDECCSTENVKDDRNDDTGNVNCEFMKDTTEFKGIIDDIINILSYGTEVTSEFDDTCDFCNIEVKVDDNCITCDCCSQYFHVKCVRDVFEDKLCNSRVIWICSMCGNSNFVNNMLGEIGIPCHFNRYTILEPDESVTADFPELTKNKEKRCNNAKLKCQQTGSEDLLGSDWMRVRSKKRTDNKKKRCKNRGNKKRRKPVINGISLEPGVKYIGKGVKDFYERRNNNKMEWNMNTNTYREYNKENSKTNVLGNSQTIFDDSGRPMCDVLKNTKVTNGIQQQSGGGSKRLRNNKGRFVKTKKIDNKKAQGNVNLKNDCDTMKDIKNMGNKDNSETKTDEDFKIECTVENDNTATDDAKAQHNSKINDRSRIIDSNGTDHKNQTCASCEFEENEVFIIDDGCKKAMTKKIRSHTKPKCDQHTIDVDIEVLTKNNFSEELIIDDVPKQKNTRKRQKTQSINELQVYNSNENITVAQGNFNQGNYRFGFASGKQCVANSLVAILYSTKRNGNDFYTKDLDTILTLGNELYRYIQKDSTMHEDLLMISELPKELDILDNTFVISPKESVFGIIDGNLEFMAEYGALSLNQALEQELHQHDAFFMNFNRSTFSIIKRVNGFLIFDPHARDRFGRVSEHGKSILLYSTSWQGVYDYCIRLARSMNCNLHDTEFELTGVNIENKSMMLCSASVLDDNCEQSNFGNVDVDEPSTSYQYKCSTGLPDKNIDSNVKGKKHNKEGHVSSSNGWQSDSDIEIVNVQYERRPDENFKFIPISEAQKKNMCNEVGIHCEHTDMNCGINRASQIGHPLQITNITGDGNCFYRAISYIISGTEDNHFLLRRAITNHLLETGDLFINTFSHEYRSVKEYVLKKRVMDNGTWASNTEISAMANLLNTDIYSFNDQLLTWQLFSAKNPGRIDDVTTDNGIYILYTMNVHFNVVESVNVSQNNVQETTGKVDMNVTSHNKLSNTEANFSVKNSTTKKRKQTRYETCDTFEDIEPKHKQKIKKNKYNNDTIFRRKTMQNNNQRNKEKYHNDPTFRQNVTQKLAEKYRSNLKFRQNCKEKLAEKYRSNLKFRQNCKEKLAEKYWSNLKFRQKCKDKLAEKYRSNLKFRQKCKDKLAEKYRSNLKFRQKCKDKLAEKYRSNLKFRQNCKLKLAEKYQGNLKFRESVKQRCKQKFTEKYHGDEGFRKKIMKKNMKNREKIKRENTNFAFVLENFRKTVSRGPEYVCCVCLKLLFKDQVMKCIKAKYKNKACGQHGIHGPVVCVPSNTIETVKMLPRPEVDDQLISVKLKRKLSYKGYYKYKFVKTANVIQALRYLQDHNKCYFDIAINEEWHNYLSEDNIESETTNENENNEEEENEEEVGVTFDTSLQPVDRRQNLVDEYFNDIICCAPCENNSPIALLSNKSNEAKSFPVLFPTGQPTFHDTRDVKITLGRYFHNRLMHIDNRFAQNTEYIFYAQSLYELQQILSSISIALRKGSSKKDDFSKVTVSDLKNVAKIEEILKSDRGYKFLKQIRGTPPYWQATQKDIIAMVRQIGKPTFFLSFSSADFRWKEIMTTLLNQSGDQRNIEELEWADKCNLLKSNPVTVARMFDKRFHTFLKNVILSEAQPIGKVVDYFYRIEFQMRGSPHVHMLVWVENAPIFGTDKDNEVINFVDKYISCAVPCETVDRELNEIVKSVQIHSKRHSKSCKKKGTNCRFNFPRQPSGNTFVMRPTIVDKDNDDNDDNKQAMELLTSVKDAVTNEETYKNAIELFQSLGITQSAFEKANNCVATEEKIVIKRNPQDVWVNQYNPSLLRAWNANMDIQYITNVYACIIYVIGYMSKSEREMGLLLNHAASEIKEGNEDARQSLRKLGNVYMNNREVSAQESIYRVCSLRLKECSRKVEFIPVGPNPVRMSLPLSVIKNKEDDDLKKQLGFIQKRTRTSNAIVRYPRFPMDTAPEKYFLSILQLFLPFRKDEQLKPPNFETYEQFHEEGCVKLCGCQLQTVKSIVHGNMEQYEKSADDVEEAQECLSKFGPQEDAWSLLCPESEKERLDNPKPNVEVDDEEDEFFIPDFGLPKNHTSKTRQWCLDKVNGKKPEAFYTFITGGAGTGKSHLVNCIYNEATRILGKIMENPDDLSILKLAPTGIAAYNIKGQTIHSSLSIPINISLPYQPLGEEKISALRNQLRQLQIVIIDEISMVNQRLLWYIHGRLRQIKQVRNDSPFGNISVIAVGDFYQLPPVMGILKSRETGEECEDAVHIYPRNKQVDEWNKKMLHKTCTDIVCIEAEDSVVNAKKQTKICDKPRNSRQTSLLNYLWIALNARVMLIKNVDVKKGLTNGCMGHVHEIVKPNRNAKPVSIKVKFDNNEIGVQAIEMFKESMGNKYSRKQFPLKLAYACTVHKVQGLTMNEAVVCLKNTFAPGQAYVALSRVTSISGLTIEHLNPNLIYCDPNIKKCLNNMESYVQCKKQGHDSDSKFSIMLHNIQGLKQHFADLQCNDLFMNSSIICLTETWLNKDDDVFDVSIEPYKLYHQARYDSYSNTNDLSSKIKHQAHGGVAVYTKNTFTSRLNIRNNDIEAVSFLITSPISVSVSVIYRPPSYDINQFCQNLRKYLEELQKVSTKCIVMGDFNENLFKQSSRVNNLMSENQYRQHVTCSTTENNTLIDHVYSKGLDSVHAEVIPIYYSYHEAIQIKF